MRRRTELWGPTTQMEGAELRSCALVCVPAGRLEPAVSEGQHLLMGLLGACFTPIPTCAQTSLRASLSTV